MKQLILFMVMLAMISMISLTAQQGNKDQPQKGTWNFKMTKNWEAETAGDDLFGNLQNIRIGHDGRIYAVDAKLFKIYIFGKDGKFISKFGAKGEGPGEIKSMGMGAQLVVLEDVLVMTEQGRIHYFTLDGEFIESITYPSALRPRGFISRDEIISAPEVAAHQSKEPAKIIVYNLKDKSQKVITQYTAYDKASDAKQDGNRRMVVAIIVGGLTPSMIVKYNDGKLYFGRNDIYKIQCADLNGKMLNDFSIIDREQEPAPKSVFKRLEENLKNLPKDMVKNILNGLPQKATFYETFHIDEHGMLYAFRPELGDSDKQRMDIFSPTGKYLYNATLKVAEGEDISSIFFKNKTLLMVTENEDGDIKLNKYSIQMPAL